MGLRESDIARAVRAQEAAARDPSAYVRLVAGPGTGKSHTVEARVAWLLLGGADIDSIRVVSFTRAAAYDLRSRVVRHCANLGIGDSERLNVTTLHALALRVLRKGGFLEAYPADPVVLDEWELKYLFDSELSATIDRTPGRCELMRRDYEAYWSTGTWDSPNLERADPEISEDERKAFIRFHGPIVQLYSCVLPGEVVRHCVDRANAGLVSLQEHAPTSHLVVDEFQDLNPADQELVDLLAAESESLFVAGDDDQSVYSFRFAAPTGLERFPERHRTVGDHVLGDCFRCTPRIVRAASDVILNNALPERIEKPLNSLYGTADPPVDGEVLRWRFSTGRAEARAIGGSCRALIDAGMPADAILILMGNTNAVERLLQEELANHDVPFDRWGGKRLADTTSGRFVSALLRMLTDEDDRVAIRTLMGLQDGVGIKTCAKVGALALSANLNYAELFRRPLPEGVFDHRCGSAIGGVSDLLGAIQEWDLSDELGQRGPELEGLLRVTVSDEASTDWLAAIDNLPDQMALAELLAYLSADSEGGRDRVLAAIDERLGVEGDRLERPARVRLMTMHGAKGLDGRVVFIPGLEDEFFPGRKRIGNAGLVLEAARLLYVSLTRARVAAIVSLAERLFVFGKTRSSPPSRFAAHLDGPFVGRAMPLSSEEAEQLVAASDLL
jgi:DNA helicase-2/ATP-dependent DNA helicase PcrA